MSGHSKWATTKHKKAAIDAKDNHEDYSSSSWAITSSEAVQLE